MALLKFNYGLLENLKNVVASASSAGNVYITKDERAMYVDIPVMGIVNDEQVVTGAERIRIGDMRIYTYLEDLQSELSKGEQSLLTETALYYVEKKGKGKPVEEQETVNALFKWSNTANAFIQINDTASLVSRLKSLQEAVDGHTTSINGINESISNINTNIENITKENGLIDTKVKASADALTEVINGKVSQGDFNNLNTTVTNHIDAQATKDQGQDNLINALNTLVGHKDNGENDPATGLCADVKKNASDIEDIRDTIEALTGTEGGSIGEQIDEKIAAAQATQKVKDDAQDELISGLTTELNGYKESVANTYVTKKDLTDHNTAADAKFATKEELNAHAQEASNTYATKTALGEVSTVANRADAQAATNNTAIANLGTEFSNYKTSNDQALAGVKATAEAAVKQSDYDTKMAALDKEDQDIRDLIAAETTRATGIESDHETRIAEMETFWKVSENPTEAIDTLKEIVDYIESDESGAAEMLGKINQNTSDIATINEIIGSDAYTDEETGTEIPASGLKSKIKVLEDGLANEVTARQGDVNDLYAFINEKLTWGTF